MEKGQKETIIKEFGRSEGDVGSTEVQVALLSARIKEMTEHMKQHPKDHGSERGLVAMVNRRRKLLNYLSKENHEEYVKIVKRLKLRR